MQEFIELRKCSSETGLIKRTWNYILDRKNSFDTKLKQFPKIKELFSGNIPEKFKLYGTIHNLKVEKQFSDNFKHKETFDVFKIDSFFSLFKRNKDLNESKKSIEIYNDVKISIQEFEKIKFYKNEFETDVYITAKGENLDFIFNSEFEFHKAIIVRRKVNNTVINHIFPLHHELRALYQLKEINKNNEHVRCRFPCENAIVDEMRNMPSSLGDDEKDKHKENFKTSLRLITHFNTFPFDFDFEKYEVTNGFRQKTKEIEEMDLDLLYIYSIFYINILHKIEDEKVNERCNQLKEKLRKIDEIWNPVISKDKIDFNEKN